MNNSLDNLKVLKERMVGGDKQYLDQLDEWEKAIKESSRMEELGKHAVVEEILRQIKEQIKAINDQLKTNKTCDRDELFARRDCWHWLINLFTGASATLEEIDKQIEDNLKN